MAEQPFSLNSWMAEIGDLIPEDWAIIVTVRHGEAEIDLMRPDGELVEFDDGDDDLDVDQMIERRVDHARVQDGLEPHFGEAL